MRNRNHKNELEGNHKSGKKKYYNENKCLFKLHSTLDMAGEKLWMWTWVNRKYPFLGIKRKIQSEHRLRDLDITNHWTIQQKWSWSPRWTEKVAEIDLEEMEENFEIWCKDASLHIQDTPSEHDKYRENHIDTHESIF